eukprot:5560965-Lingulodinium_polyedra.AAC.1
MHSTWFAASPLTSPSGEAPAAWSGVGVAPGPPVAAPAAAAEPIAGGAATLPREAGAGPHPSRGPP